MFNEVKFTQFTARFRISFILEEDLRGSEKRLCFQHICDINKMECSQEANKV